MFMQNVVIFLTQGIFCSMQARWSLKLAVLYLAPTKSLLFSFLPFNKTCCFAHINLSRVFQYLDHDEFSLTMIPVVWLVYYSSTKKLACGNDKMMQIQFNPKSIRSVLRFYRHRVTSSEDRIWNDLPSTIWEHPCYRYYFHSKDNCLNNAVLK